MNRIGSLLLLCLLSALAAAPLAGQEPAVQPDARKCYFSRKFYVGMFVPYTVLKGEFRGDRYLLSDRELVLLPSLSSAPGIGIALGGMVDEKERMAWEVSYAESRHTARWEDRRTDATHRMLNIDAKFSFMTDSRVRPFMLVGAHIPSLTVENAATDGFTLSNAVFNGYGLNLGCGFSTFLTRRLSVAVGATYRLACYTTVKATTGSFRDTDFSIDASGVNASLGIEYAFFTRRGRPYGYDDLR